jgi:K+-sensing histidine kinase KdpD
MKKIGYVFVGPKTPSKEEQIKRLVGTDVGSGNIWIDTQARVRPERRDMIELDVRAGESDVVVICTPAIMGSGQKDTSKAVLEIGEKGAAVQVIGSDPVVYMTQEQADAFGKVALSESRRANALENVRAGRVGRKSKWEMTEVEEGLLRILWHDLRVPMARILDVVAYLGGKSVTREDLYSRLGAREKQKEPKT